MPQTPYHLYRVTDSNGATEESTDFLSVKTWRDTNAPGTPIFDITIASRTIYAVTVGNTTQSWPDDLPAAEAWRDANAPGAQIGASTEEYEVEPYDIVPE
jgi:hypothetical protein